MVTGMPLLPGWLAVVLAAALGAVGLVHLRHAWAMRGERRWWHAGHMGMAAGMIVMCLLPQPGHAGLYWADVCLFGTLCLAAGAYAVASRRRDGRTGWLWAATMTDMAAMAYMALPAADRLTLLSYLLITYLCVEALLWAVIPSRPGPASPASLEPGRGPGPGVRTTLVVMSVSMAWMLIAMQEMYLAPGAPGAPMHM